MVQGQQRENSFGKQALLFIAFIFVSIVLSRNNEI